MFYFSECTSQHGEKLDALRQQITLHYRASEQDAVHICTEIAELDSDVKQRIKKRASSLVEGIRDKRDDMSFVDKLISEYGLDIKEGITLMCLAECLLRVPDADTQDKLISDKIGGMEWTKYLGSSDSWFVNASTFGLMITGKLTDESGHKQSYFTSILGGMVSKMSEPVIRKAMKFAMSSMGNHFILGTSIQDALKRAKVKEKNGYTYSYDMLGEAAMTQEDAIRYFDMYMTAIEEIGKTETTSSDIHKRPNISIKLSALHPRYEVLQYNRLPELIDTTRKLAYRAAELNIGLCIDAEEARRLDLSLDVIYEIAMDPKLKEWQGLGLALQTYQKRAIHTIDWLIELHKQSGKQFMVRLVKGAYWDTEIKLSQEAGVSDYPVYTRKANTDVSYAACTEKLLEHPEAFFPCFATHNAYSIASIIEREKKHGNSNFEFQKLHGMGDALHNLIISDHKCRIYAPVGKHDTLLPYLVRRLLENGSNNSFVNKIAKKSFDPEELIRSPLDILGMTTSAKHDGIPLPIDIFSDTKNSIGVDLDDLHSLRARFTNAEISKNLVSCPIVDGKRIMKDLQIHEIVSPIDNRSIGKCHYADTKIINIAFESALKHQKAWSNKDVEYRAEILEKTADEYEKNTDRFIELLINEAGKILSDAISEIREAVDFLRYYASQARKICRKIILEGITGEDNTLHISGRGIFLCISPWNFPFAIFIGQVAAALVTGNAVLAKPAEQTSAVGSLAVEIMHKCGMPKEILQYIPGPGPTIGNTILPKQKLGGVCFTGSTATAQLINKKLASRDAPIIPLIAETGGINAMIVDSTALPEHFIRDVVRSAFQSAGQRCSALRVLFLQSEIYDDFMHGLKGAMQELVIGNPRDIKTDVGPIIDNEALEMLNKYRKSVQDKILFECEMKNQTGNYFAPIIIELNSLTELKKEIFGPCLHVIKYKSSEMNSVIDSINATGYGLTFGLQTRLNKFAQEVANKIHAGNVYINRNQIGAVVRSQPFGGEGLSGTGPKAGGPHYLYRFIQEKTVSIDLTVSGGNTQLVTMES